ncbi:MAG TPA: hybrid sensor histidine kinase/response regulator [Oxalicibacterium sp.]|uniref:hybrid sensor histidine kinase/response regulator n=1 Tax=Oxalicibacterium sp. TaxID=2766525 RepID=UPI002C0856A0|nr:hybrid sensor histidine kinase/response regulator [Oxalicibacterium sp.]HWU98980.1 hybrid sensor histidine kinase/response regulator [Oxalicibacterium sp.]
MHTERTKLLIVDDLQDNLRALNALIRKEDRLIYEATSGEEALTLMLEHEFALAILDVQMPDMDGFELAELMRGTEKTRHIPIVFVSAAGKELNYAFKGYESGAVDFLYKPLDFYAVQSKVSVFVDLYQQRNETRRQVAALEKSRQEQEVLMQELHAAQKQLQHAVRMRDEFMSMVAHELRTPLNTLFLETQMRKMQLERGDIAVFNADRLEKMVARDGRQIQSMIRLIDDMLDVSRIRSGRLSIRPAWTELSSLLVRIVGDLTAQAAASGTTIELVADEEVSGMWDEFRIEQVIVNLLTNAIRYGQKKPIEVSLVTTANSARIYVKDQGNGISAEDQQRIFEPFERGAGNHVSAGLGLGLYISRQLVEAHNGTISVQSNPGKGTVFTVALPLSQDHHLAPEA